MTEEQVFLAALDLPNGADRAAYLDEVCGQNSERRRQIEELLAAHERSGQFLDQAAAEQMAAGLQSLTAQTVALNAESDDAMTNGKKINASPSDDDADDLPFLSPSTRLDSLGRLGHYEMLQVLGKGGFGIVFRAFDETLQRVVAVKVMAPQIATLSPARKRFLREAQSSAQVRHENVVQIYEVGERPLPYLAMEFIPGETLQQKLDRSGPLDVREVLRIGRQVAEGLAAAHACDLIHRDIKPANVLIEGGPQQRVKITDFGLARAADDASISQSGVIAGTPMYMAPEQALGHKLDQRADLFSFGSVLYQMASGRPPFRAPSTLAVLKRVAEESPRPIAEIIPETPTWLCEIITKLHTKDPDDRYQSAREIADVLADCEAQLKAHARIKDFSRIPRGKPRRSGRWKWVAAAAVLLLSMIALAVTECAGVTHLFRQKPAASDANKSIGDPQSKPGAGWNDWPADAPPPAIAPFDAAQARAHQEAWAKYLGAPAAFTNKIGMKLRFIAPGKFRMGSSQEEIDFWLKQNTHGWASERLPGEGPQHEVEITQPFYMGQTEVTVGRFRQFVTAHGYKTQAEREGGAYRRFPNGEWKMDPNTTWLNPGFAQTDDHPVVCISWNDAVEFCNWLSRQEGKDYRLPTEAEWEYSCRAGSKGRWSFGDGEGELWNYARIEGNSQLHAWPVAGLKENPWGLDDMHGNVWEWCQDVYDPNYYKTSPPQDPPGPSAGGERVVRGGSWDWSPVVCRSAFRGSLPPDHRDHARGFRVVLVVSPPSGVQAESGAKDKPSPAAITPFTDANVQRIAALPAAEQVEEVRKELMQRNPAFDGKIEYKVEDGVVTEFRIVTDKVTDAAPIRVFDALRVLECRGTSINFRPNGQLADLTPLEGMNLAALTYLNLSSTKVGDAGMVYFKGCKNLTHIDLFLTQVTDAGLVNFQDSKAVTHLYLGWTQVGDAGMANFKGCKNLTDLWLFGTQVGDAGVANFEDCKAVGNLNLSGTTVSDLGLANFTGCKQLMNLYLDHTQVGDATLARFKGMPLRELTINGAGITDLTPLRGMPLEVICLTPKKITRGMDILRDTKGLKFIGVEWNQTWPAAEFWERYDKGEFKE